MNTEDRSGVGVPYVRTVALLYHGALLCFSRHEADGQLLHPGFCLAAAVLSHSQRPWPKGELYWMMCF